MKSAWRLYEECVGYEAGARRLGEERNALMMFAKKATAVVIVVVSIA
jgi:hypothetical protein